MLGKIRLLLVEVDRDQFEPDRRLLLQLHQDVEHRVAVLAAGQAHHDLVAVLDHAEIGDRATDLVAQALGELVRLVLATLVGAHVGPGFGQREGKYGTHRTAILTAAAAMTLKGGAR